MLSCSYLVVIVFGASPHYNPRCSQSCRLSNSADKVRLKENEQQLYNNYRLILFISVICFNIIRDYLFFKLGFILEIKNIAQKPQMLVNAFM